MGEYRSTRGEKPPASAVERKHRAAIGWLRAAVVVAALVLAGRFIEVPRRVPASGYATTSPYAEVRSPVNGVVASIEAGSGDAVKKGDILVRLVDELERTALERAEIEEQRARSELELKTAEYRELLRSHSNSVQVAALSLDYAQKRLGITRQLVEKGLASSRDLMADEHQLALAAMQYRQLGDRDMSTGLRQIGLLEKQLAAASAAVKSARADLDARVVRAPVDGRLLRHSFFVGEVARADQVLFEVFGNEEVLLRLRVPERYATRISKGMPVRAQLRTAKRLFGRNWIKAEVGALRDAIQAEGNETYRVIYCPYETPGFDIPPGTTADAEILVGRVPLWRIVFDD